MFCLVLVWVELRGLEPLTPCLQIAVIGPQTGTELGGSLAVSNRDMPPMTRLNGTLMARLPGLRDLLIRRIVPRVRSVRGNPNPHVSVLPGVRHRRHIPVPSRSVCERSLPVPAPGLSAPELMARADLEAGDVVLRDSVCALGVRQRGGSGIACVHRARLPARVERRARGRSGATRRRLRGNRTSAGGVGGTRLTRAVRTGIGERCCRDRHADASHCQYCEQSSHCSS